MNVIPPKPPDPPDKIPVPEQNAANMDLSPPVFSLESQDNVNRKRGGVSLEGPNNKKASTEDTIASPSAQNLYTHPRCNMQKTYSNDDSGPFIVHVFRPEPNPAIGSTINPMKFGQFLFKHKIKDIIRDGIKSIGRNRISVQFSSYEAANSFLSNSHLAENKFSALVPTFSVTRMGIVRGVPLDWAMSEFAESLEFPEGCGMVLKARRLNRKSIIDGVTTWLPTGTVVLTFSGQLLPSKVYCFNTALTVEIYQLPSIQCGACCRFGHVKAQCRSKPRCFKCAQFHLGDSCPVLENEASCLFCSGSHFATSISCPEQSRQKSIKMTMSQENISYNEASSRFPPVRRSYAHVANTTIPSSSFQTSSYSVSDQPPIQRQMPQSYKKTITLRPKPRAPLPQGYDKVAHQSIVGNYNLLSPQNGCALLNPSHPNSPNNPTVSSNENLIELLINVLINLFSKFNEVSPPSNVADKLNELFKIIGTNGSISSMEL